MFKLPYCFYSLGIKLRFRSREWGMTLVEVILIAVFLGVLAIGTTYFFAQTQITMRSSSQSMECQGIAKQALENVVSMGTRLYGYTINNKDSDDLRYNPLFLKKSGSNAVDVGDGSDLVFPPQMYKNLFEKLGIKKGDSTDYNSSNPEKNSGVPIVTSSTDPPELGTSVFLINSVNALQYLYNSNKNFFTGHSGKGEKYTSSSMSRDVISEALNKYESKFNLENAEFYIKIAPVNLSTNEVIDSYAGIECYKTTYKGTKFDSQSYACPTASGHTLVLTRPRLLLPSNTEQVAKGLVLVGNENMGLEIKVHLKYEQGDQEFSCDAMHRFDHQVKPITGSLAASNPLAVEVFGLTNGSGRDLLNKENKQTSCNEVDGAPESNYNDISLKLNFQGFKRGSSGEEFGTLLLCKGKTACKSDGDGSYPGCSVKEANWQRCHEFKFEEQAGSTDAELLADDQLQLTFNNLKENRRYDLSIKEVSMLEWSKRSVKLDPNESRVLIGVDGIETIRFYIDAKRPTIASLGILGDTVGAPDDGIGGRNYQGPETKWTPPPGISKEQKKKNQWLQCDKRDVNTYADIKDQFTHNLEPCKYSGDRTNGAESIELAEGFDIIVGYDFKLHRCSGKVKYIDHGRYTIKAEPHDTCDAGTKGEIVWDTDLPKTFEAQELDDKWFLSTAKVPYTIKTKVPTKTPDGKFPKHYSVTCFEKEYGTTNVRTDGNSGPIDCKFVNGNLDRDDGCNPENYGIQYHHVCGASGCKDSKKWGVYAPLRKSCLNVRCEPGLSCCDASGGTCNGVNDKECGKANTRDCTNPKGGKQASADEAPSVCPPLGLNTCTYALPCNASPDPGQAPTDPCDNKRRGQGCSFDLGGTCVPTFTGWSSSPQTGGTVTFGSYTESCTSNVRPNCVRWNYRDECRAGNNIVSCPCTVQGCTSKRVRGSCAESEYMAITKPGLFKTFTGTCGQAVGSCSPLGVGGGNLSLEKCDVRDPTNTNMCPVPPPPPCECDNSVLHGCSRGCSAVNKGESADKYSYLWHCDSPTANISGECNEPKEISQCDYSVNPTLPIQRRINKCTNGGSPTNQDETMHYYKWKCTSPDDNKLITSGSCIVRKPCDTNATQYACPSGITAINKKDNKCSWTWECPNPDSILITPNQCELKKKVSECDNNPEHGCTNGGTAVNKKQKEEITLWECASSEGINCITSKQCFYCDSTQHCCLGDTAATNPNCPSPECGVCGPWKGASNESCSSGTFHPHPPDTATEYKWTCRNEPHVAEDKCAEGNNDPDTREASCGPAPKPPVICGACGTGSIECAGNGGPNKESCCSEGSTFHSNPPDTSTTWEWSCKNDPHVTSDACAESSTDTDKRQVSCSKEKSSVECGACGVGSSQCAGQGGPNKESCCSKGEFHGNLGDTATHWNWTCKNDPHVANDACAESPSDADKRQISCSESKPPCDCKLPATNSDPYTCSGGCTAKNIRQHFTSDGWRFLHGGLRANRMGTKEVRWECEASGGVSMECSYRTRRCTGSEERDRNSGEIGRMGQTQGWGGYDGCEDRGGHFEGILGGGRTKEEARTCKISSLNGDGSSSSCNYIGYCDKGTFGSCHNACHATTCDFNVQEDQGISQYIAD